MDGPLRLRDLVIDPPLLNASGAFDVSSLDPDWSQSVDAAAPLGAYVTKTVTRAPRAGNPKPWVALWGEDGSLVNSVGLANPGIDAALAAWAGLNSQLGCPVLLSVGGGINDIVELVRQSEAAGWVAGYELNLSCPNDATGEPLIAGDPVAVGRACAAVRSVTGRPVLAKLSAACSDLTAVARAAEAAGADALVAINTMPVRTLDDDCEPLLGTLDGGLSGPALHPIALRCVAVASAAVEIPVVGVGGVGSIASMRRMLGAGARAVGVGSAAAIAPIVLAELATVLNGRQAAP